MKNILNIFAFLVLFICQSQAQSLKEGDKAPNFTVQDVQGNNHVLKTTAKKNKVLLVFLRYAWCPICNLRTHELIEQYESLKAKGYEVIAFYQSPKEQMATYIEDRKIPFPVVADYEGVYYKMYKLEYNQAKVDADLKTDRTLNIAKKALALSDMEADQKKYGAEKENADALIPGDFVVDKKGKLERVHYGAFFGDHLSLDELK